MRRFLRRQIPSMFHRRLLLLLLTAVGVTLTLGVQTARLTVGAEHERSLARVQNALRTTRLVPTVRGRIVDRWGRVLAVDEPGYDVAVQYEVISGDWAFNQARRVAREANRAKWNSLTAEQREALIAQARPPFDRQMNQLWQTLAALGGVERAELERRQTHVTRRIQNMASHLWAVWQRDRAEKLGEPVSLAEVAQPIGPQVQAHPMLRDIDEPTRLQILSFIAEAERDPALAVWRQVELQHRKQRRYPLETMTVMVDTSHLPGPLRQEGQRPITVEGLGIHILGQMRDVWKEDINGPNGRPFDAQDDLGGYQAGDRAGSFGIEKAMEDVLRGTRGRVIRRRDTGAEQRIEPRPGDDVQLTIDIQLQAQVQALLTPELGLMQVQPWQGNSPEVAARAGEPLNGAAVVLDIQSGEVLAAVSMPAMPLDVLAEQPERIFNDRLNEPYLNRVVSHPYPPGSIVKPLMLAAAATSGVHPLHAPIVCNGHLNPDDPNHYRCWIYKGFGAVHGPLDGAEAIARSCNIYFYTLGRDMGVAGVAEWYAGFGLGATSGSGLPEEVGGSLPSPAQFSSYHTADAIFMGIGQGPVAWTPLQAAASYAALARGGLYMSPTFIKDEDRREPRTVRDLHLNQAAVFAALEGLNGVVHASYGSGRKLHLLNELIFNVEGVKVIGKSGTADPGPSRWVDFNTNGKVDEGERLPTPDDHAWFVVIIQPDGAPEPTHVIAVVSEYGGSGGQVSGTVTNQIIHAMQQTGRYF